jgi:hypothetical protein
MNAGRANDNFRVLAEGRLVDHGHQVFGLLDRAVAFPVSTDKELAGFDLVGRVKGTVWYESKK